MIDTVRFMIPATGCDKRIAAYLRKHPKCASRKWQGAARINNKNSSGCAWVKARDGGKTLWIEASLSKLLCGHNVFGSNRLVDMCLATVRLVTDRLRIKRNIKAHHIQLTRVDIGCQIPLKPNIDFPSLLNELHAALRAEGFALTVHEKNGYVETIYINKDSTLETLKIYDKSKELRKHKLSGEVEDQGKIRRYASFTIRLEWEIKRDGLVKLDLRAAKRWTPNLVMEMIEQRLQKLQLGRAIPLPVRADVPKGVSLRETNFLRLWLNNSDLKRHLEKRTFNRLRKKLLPVADVGKSPPQKEQIDFGVLADPSKVRFAYPRWARETIRAALGRPV